MFHFAIEEARGYASNGELWRPGTFSIELARASAATFSASTESWETLTAHSADEALHEEQRRRRRLLDRAVPSARSGVAAELVLAADAFVITPAVSRQDELPRARAADDDVRSVIAGYHWFTDWGRDTMISLEGLTLVTGRHEDAGYILRTFARYVREGLIPNLFPEGEKEGLYHTADATLWFFHALARYHESTQDDATLQSILPKLVDIFEHHVRGTRFGIGIDPADGLLTQGAPGYQLTWMDAKVGDWVVTPRRGKAVELNALWYNALRLLERWLREAGEQRTAGRVASHADAAYHSFNRRFWYAQGGYLYDVVDGEEGDDPALRPNQIFAISLEHAVLDAARWRSVVDAVSAALLTPVGLRTLAPGHPNYDPCYDGDVRARDAAYHQGTVWPWLIGPFIDACLRLSPDEPESAQRLLAGFDAHLGEAGVGFVSEIFDAAPPFRPRGCIAQAWSVAEVLRSLVKLDLAAYRRRESRPLRSPYGQ
jgi:predicted glycogen debranching enzyme